MASTAPTSVHGTRHTYGSLLAALEVHPRVAMQILRHSKIAATMEIYTHILLCEQLLNFAAVLRPQLSRRPLSETGEGLWPVNLSVELRGLEPLTPSLRTRCATSCATAPWCGRNDNTEATPARNRFVRR